MKHGVPIDGASHVRILVVGDADVGKTTLVQNLCAGLSCAEGLRSGIGCNLSLRVGADGVVEEYYDVAGSEHFVYGRPLFYQSQLYDALMLVHDLSEPATRISLSRVWVPEAMRVLGDVPATEASGRPESAGPHIRVRGAVNELRSLWLHVQSRHAYGGLTSLGAAREAIRLGARLFRLALNEYGLWTDESIDMVAEHQLLQGCRVPVAIVGLKKDLIPEHSCLQRSDNEVNAGRAIFVTYLRSREANEDSSITTFLQMAAEHAKRRSATPSPKGSDTSPHVSLALTYA